LSVNSVTIDACPMVYECKVVHYNDLIPGNLDTQIETTAYKGGNYHRLYYGEILGAYASEDY
jgi:flavin reductase (DIM6/NTAB) family NADH-FMN oxidoreductase RutF